MGQTKIEAYRGQHLNIFKQFRDIQETGKPVSMILEYKTLTPINLLLTELQQSGAMTQSLLQYESPDDLKLDTKDLQQWLNDYHVKASNMQEDSKMGFHAVSGDMLTGDDEMDYDEDEPEDRKRMGFQPYC